MLRDKRTALWFAATFVAWLAVLMLPWPGLGKMYSRAFAVVGNALVGGHSFASGARLAFDGDGGDDSGGETKTFAWEATLTVQNANGARIQVPIDVRPLAYLPTAAFAALALAFPIRERRRKLFVFAAGLVIMQPLTALLISLPLLPFLGGSGPIRVFELGPAARSLIEAAYRALVAPPGMTYAIPGLLFWTLFATTDPKKTLGAKIHRWLHRGGAAASVV